MSGHQRSDRDVERPVRCAPDRERLLEERVGFTVEAHRSACRGAMDVRQQAVVREAAEAGVPVLDLFEGRFAGGQQVPTALQHHQLAARPHRRDGQPDRGPPHALLTLQLSGSYSNVPPSHSDRVARSTMTITLVPRSTSLAGWLRVRMHSSQCSRSAS